MLYCYLFDYVLLHNVTINSVGTLQICFILETLFLSILCEIIWCDIIKEGVDYGKLC